MSSNDNAFDKAGISLHWDGVQGGAAGAVCHGGHIIQALPDNNRMLTLLISDLSVYQNTRNFDDLNKWITTHVADKFPHSMSWQFKISTDRLISTVAFGNYVYIFWCSQSDGSHSRSYFALRMRPDMLEPLAVVQIDMGDLFTTGTAESNISAFALPNRLDSFTNKIGMVVVCNSNERAYMACGVLDPMQFVGGSDWKAQDLNDGWMVALRGIASDSNFINKYHGISAGWVDQGTVQSHQDQQPQPYVSLVVLCSSESGDPHTISFGVDLLQAFDLTYRHSRTSNDSQIDPINIGIHKSNNSAISYSATLSTAPDGSMTAMGRNNSNHVQYARLQLNTSDAKSANYQQPGLYSPTWMPLSTHMNSLTTHNTPCSVFIPLGNHFADSPVAVKSPSGASQIYRDCPTIKYVHVVLASDSSNKPTLSTAFWGTLFSIPGYQTLHAEPNYHTANLLTLVGDSFPFPVPDPAVWDSNSPSGMVNWLCCNYEYLVGNDSEVDIDYNVSSAVGYQFETNMTGLAGGVQADISGSVGFTTFVNSSKLKRRATSYSITTKGLPQDEPPEDEQLSTQDNSNDASCESLEPIEPKPTIPLRIANQGALFGSSPPEQLAVDIALVLPRGASKVSDAMATIVRPILDSSLISRGGDFASYCYTPGDLRSYDQAQIGGLMQHRFAQLSSAQQQEFVINGEDFRSLYTRDYINNVAKRFGKNCFGPSNNLPYLEFSFSETGIQRSEFQSTSNFTVGGSAFVNGSAYAGVAWNYDAGISFGLLGALDLSVTVFNASGYAMVGVEFSSSLGSSSSNANSWGVKLGEYLNPLAPGEAYTARMYFLEPSPLWAMELKHFGFPSSDYPDSVPIDLINSCPIRVLFTVPYVSEPLIRRLQNLCDPLPSF